MYEDFNKWVFSKFLNNVREQCKRTTASEVPHVCGEILFYLVSNKPVGKLTG